MFGETVASSLTGVKSHSTKKESTGPAKGETQPGIVTVIDMLNIGEGQVYKLFILVLHTLRTCPYTVELYRVMIQLTL